MFGGYAFQTAGLQYTTPAKSGFVTGSSVVLVPLLLGIFWKRRLTAWIYFGTLAAVGGLYLLTGACGGSYATESWRFADTGRGGFVCGAHHPGRGLHAETFRGGAERVAGGRVRGAGLGGDGGGFGDGMASGELAWRWELGAAIVICAVFATAIAFSTQLWAQQYTTPSHAAIIFTLEPVFAVITSYLVIGERFDGRSKVGAFCWCWREYLIAELLGPAAAPESPEPMGERV